MSEPSGQLARIPGKTVAEKVRELQEQAQGMATDHARQFATEIEQLVRLAKEIAEGGEVYLPGVRELASRMASQLEGQAQTILQILSKSIGRP